MEDRIEELYRRLQETSKNTGISEAEILTWLRERLKRVEERKKALSQ